MSIFGAPANSAAVMAGGVKFYLVGRGAAPAGAIVHKFQTAMTTARTKLASAIALVSQNPVALTARQDLVLEYCFNPTVAQRPATLLMIKTKLTATLAGLRTADLEIHDPDPASLPPGAEGYVMSVLGVKGAIRTRFDLAPDRTAHNLVHEGTHRFSDTVDPPGGYIANNLDLFVNLRLMGIAGNAPTTNAVALTNADSYAGFAMKAT